jgi:hypothetical protein
LAQQTLEDLYAAHLAEHRSGRRQEVEHIPQNFDHEEHRLPRNPQIRPYAAIAAAASAAAVTLPPRDL